MNDRELLERAAKVAGIEFGADRLDCGLSLSHPPRFLPKWNPLENSGDAFELACKLKLNIIQGDFSAVVNDEDEIEEAALVKSDEDRCAVVRGLIVRAAAALAGD